MRSILRPIRLFALVVCLLWTLPGAAVAGSPPADPTLICPLLPGEVVPTGLSVRAPDGETVDLSAALVEPTVLVFFRGGWCPYCNAHLADLQRVQGELTALGYTLIALTPDRPGKVASLLSGGEVGFTVLSDSPMTVSDAFGLSFRVSDDIVERYRGWNIDLEGDSGQTHHLLPVPAAYVVTRGVVRFAYVNPDYRTRVDGDVLLAAARVAMRADPEAESGR